MVARAYRIAALSNPVESALIKDSWAIEEVVNRIASPTNRTRVLAPVPNNIVKTFGNQTSKMLGVIRTCAVRKVSKTRKPDNKRITALLRF